MSFWDVDYFGLKSVKAQKTQEELLFPINYLKEIRGPSPKRELSPEITTKNIR